ncbi:MAG: Gfo/Idh/MocA family oxidoreductase [Anaerolineae bacterium]|nr:MAG: Gfo/Idh/MocA family oxidoreductase [Anaerolineae bacterium]
MTRILISGLGSIGRRHLGNLVELGVADILLHRTGKSTLPDDDLKEFESESDLARALERWQPDAILVTNPTALHLDIAVPAARSGCHLFIEKPLSHSMQGIDDLEAAVESGGGQVLIGFHFRFNPGLRAIKELLKEGAVGRPLSARVYWGEHLPDWHPWEDYRASYSARSNLGGGVVLTLSHPFDYLRWLLGEISDVQALTANSGSLGIDVEDTASVLMGLEQGLVANVQLDYLRRPPAHSLEIIGTEGAIQWEGLSGHARWYDPKDAQWNELPPPEGFERNTMFMEEMRHFLAIVAGEEQPACGLKDGIRVLEIVEAVHESAKTGSRVALMRVKA